MTPQGTDHPDHGDRADQLRHRLGPSSASAGRSVLWQTSMGTERADSVTVRGRAHTRLPMAPGSIAVGRNAQPSPGTHRLCHADRVVHGHERAGCFRPAAADHQW